MQLNIRNLTAFKNLSERLSELGKDISGDLGNQMLDEGSKIVKGVMVFDLNQSIKHPDRSSGEMVASVDDVGVSSLTREIYPQGRDTQTGVRNAAKMYMKHYGNSRQQGDRIVDKITADSAPLAYEAMSDVFKEYMKSRQ